MTDASLWAPVLLAACGLLSSCNLRESNVVPVIEFNKIPAAGPGGRNAMDTIAGRVAGARRGQRIVLFAKSGQWWVQPLASQPYTEIQSDSTWSSSTHLGTEYAALLVDSGYIPPTTANALPAKGGAIAAVAVTRGRGLEQRAPKTLQFSGYEWEIRQEPSDRGGTTNAYDPANAWTDKDGFLHLRIARAGDGWTCAEVTLRRSLGCGSYVFVVRDVSHLEPAAVLGMFTWDDLAADQNYREMDIEISRWGDPRSRNAQYAIQPYYVPVNVVRFVAPPGMLTHSLEWEPGRVSFKTVRGYPGRGSRLVAENAFTSGVPSPGGESVRLNLYIFGRTRTPLKNDVEVVVEKFQYLP